MRRSVESAGVLSRSTNLVFDAEIRPERLALSDRASTTCILHRMAVADGFTGLATRLGLGLHDRVLSRDDAHLAPPCLTKAAAQRLRAGMRALEAYLRRLIVYLALQIAPDLPRDRSEVPLYHRPRTAPVPGFRFRSFARTGPAKGLVPADPLLSRLRHLKALLEAPDKRARRLAFHLARKRPGLIAPPGFAARFRARYGTEISALYDSLGPAILDASRARPPPLGPVPRPGPRITRL